MSDVNTNLQKVAFEHQIYEQTPSRIVIALSALVTQQKMKIARLQMELEEARDELEEARDELEEARDELMTLGDDK